MSILAAGVHLWAEEGRGREGGEERKCAGRKAMKREKGWKIRCSRRRCDTSGWGKKADRVG